MRLFRFLAAPIVLASIMVLPGQALAAACPAQTAIAHRFGTEHYTENTRNAERDASNRGVPFWETDVQWTSDNVPVIMHDDTVDRTTNGTGAVADLTFEQFQALRTADDQPVPSLREVINDAAVDNAKIFMELKTDPTDDQWDTLLDVLNSRGGASARITITSFHSDVLIKAHAKAPAFQTGWIMDVGDVDAELAASVAPILIKHHDAITSARIGRWDAAGLKVYAWTVDTTAEWLRMTWYPALDGVITNLPTAYRAWQRARVC